MINIIQVESEQQISQFRELIIRYAEEMGFDLQQPKLNHELEQLPGDYSPSSGFILLAVEEEAAVGCAALRRLDPDLAAGEIRRLYVTPKNREAGTAGGLMLTLIKKAREIGYQRVRLITLPSMQQAIKIYLKLGFGFIQPYRETSDPSAYFMELKLE